MDSVNLLKIKEIIAPSLEEMGYEVIRITTMGGDRRSILQIMADKIDRTNLSVGDCTVISRAISALLDVEDVISGAYNLEISSPGIDRPLTRLEDFVCYKGFDVKVELDTPLPVNTGQGGADRRRFNGQIIEISDAEEIRLKNENEEVVLPYALISKAKLVLTDELIKAAQNGDFNKGV
ncbi:MAG: ribosome maturation factor RimP [Alphaproteobacteria bacterium]